MRNLIAFSLLFLCSFGFAQKKELTLRSAVLNQWNGLAPERLWGLQWIEGTNDYVFQQLEDDGLFIYRAAVKRGSAEKMMSLDALNTCMGTDMKFIPALTWTSSNRFVLQYKENLYAYDLSTNKCLKLFELEGNAQHLDAAPDYKHIAYTVDQNLYVQAAMQPAKAITKNEQKDIISGQAVHRYEFGITKGTFWSPKSTHLAFYQKDESMVTDYPLVDLNFTPARVNMIKYPMAGQNSHHVKVGVYSLADQKTIWLKTGEPLEQFITGVTWSPDEKHIYLTTVNRDQNHIKLKKFDAKTGELVSILFEEKDEKYVEPEHPLTFIPGNDDQFIWWSERDGWQHLYLYGTDGKLIRQLTKGEWEVEVINGFDEKGSTVFIEGTANAGLDRQIYKVSLSSGSTTQVTKEKGTHHAQLSSDGNYLLDEWSSLTVPRNIEIINTSGKVLHRKLKAANPLEEYAVGTTELLDVKAKDGTPLHCRLIKPSDFDPEKKYPVLIYVYGGPRAQMITNSWLGGARLWMHWMAEQGYLVFTMDNRGSENRGLAFEQAVFRNLGKLELEDQIQGIEWLKSQKYVDFNRFAVHGWSFGGYMTTSMMLKTPNTFNVGVAGGPVTDWAYYEIMYGEKYMDHPKDNPEGYAYGRLKNYVDKLKGKLLIIHGGDDDVVVKQHALVFLKEAVTKGVQVDYFEYPGHKHNVGGFDRYHLMTKVLNYILEYNKAKE